MKPLRILIASEQLAEHLRVGERLVARTPADAWIFAAGSRPVLEWFAAGGGHSTHGSKTIRNTNNQIPLAHWALIVAG